MVKLEALQWETSISNWRMALVGLSLLPAPHDKTSLSTAFMKLPKEERTPW